MVRLIPALIAAAAMLGAPAHANPAPTTTATPAPAPAPTEVVVRVISQDAKWVGDLTGGAEVRLVDVASGALLAEGKVVGSTGDTPAIMAAQGRAPLRSTEGSAAFRTALSIDRPTLVRVEVRGPLGYPQTMQRASSERWLIPGQSMAGADGWVIELPGLAITLVDTPAKPQQGTARQGTARQGTPQQLTAHVQLMCGCPITAGGMWDAAEYSVTTEILQPGAAAVRMPMTFAEAPGRYATRWTPAQRGKAEITITAINRRTGNAGVLRTFLAIE